MLERASVQDGSVQGAAIFRSLKALFDYWHFSDILYWCETVFSTAIAIAGENTIWQNCWLWKAMMPFWPHEECAAVTEQCWDLYFEHFCCHPVFMTYCGKICTWQALQIFLGLECFCSLEPAREGARAAGGPLPQKRACHWQFKLLQFFLMLITMLI